MNQSIDNTPDKNGNSWPQDIKFVLTVTCDNINLKDLLENTDHEFLEMRMKVSWKKTQIKQSTPVIAILGLPADLNRKGVEATIGYGLKQSKDYLLQAGTLNFQYAGEKIPDSSMYYKKAYTGWLSPKLFEETRLDTIPGYDAKIGCRLLNVEAEKKHWDDSLAAIWNHFASSHGLRRIVRHAEVHVNLTKVSDMEDVVEFEKNLGKHVPYCLTVRYAKMLEILTLKKLVEVKFTNVKKTGQRKFHQSCS